MRSKEFSFQGPPINIWVAGLCPLLLVITKQVDHDGDVGDHDDHDGDASDADEDEADSFVSISETLITACLRLFLITNSKIDRDNDDDDDDSFVEELGEAMFLKIILAHLQLSVIIAPYWMRGTGW